MRAISLIDKTQSTEVQLKHLGRLVAELVPDNHIEIFDDKNRQLVPKNEPKYSTLAHNLAYWSDEKLKSENYAIVLDNVYKLEDIHYLEESILNLIIFASDSNVTHLPPLDGELLNLLSLVKAMRPTGDEIQLAENAILTINS